MVRQSHLALIMVVAIVAIMIKVVIARLREVVIVASAGWTSPALDYGSRGDLGCRRSSQGGGSSGVEFRSRGGDSARPRPAGHAHDPDPADTTSYVVVTPARDEAKVIARTIEALVSQSVLPARWVIVDDGSVDGTADVLSRLTSDLPWVTCLRRPDAGTADFASKVHAFNLGVDALDGTAYGLLSNLDADVTFEPDYFERLLATFADRPRLGIAGGEIVVVDRHGRAQLRRASTDSVAGAVQCFRRQCFEEVGGLLPLRRGGEDAAAQIIARSRCWEVATIPELVVQHHGAVLNRRRNATSAFFSRGLVNHSLGYDPLFQLMVSAYRTADRPYVVGGGAMLLGSLAGALTRQPRVLPPDAVAHLRHEQRRRLRRMVRRG